MERSYAGKLLEKRIECYPILYQALSGLDKSIRFGKLTKKDVEALLKAVLNWDTQYAIFMSSESGSRLHQFRMHLNKLSRMEEKAFNQKFSTNEEQLELLRKANRVEISIKNDLGIYAVETSNDEKVYNSYKDLNQAREI
jgi:hypothetical protein